MIDYDWITIGMFDEKVHELARKDGTSFLLIAIPGVYEIVAEHYNNAVLEALENERGTDDK